jgi:hypothetical protein
MEKRTFHINPQSRGRIAHRMLEKVGHPHDAVWPDCGTTMKTLPPKYISAARSAGACSSAPSKRARRSPALPPPATPA